MSDLAVLALSIRQSVETSSVRSDDSCTFQNSIMDGLTETEATKKRDPKYLGKKEVLEYVKSHRYDKYYSVKLSDDGKYFEITIKKTTCATTAAILKKDFGLRDGVIREHNESLLKDRNNSLQLSHTTAYNDREFKTGDVIRVPVSEVRIEDGDTPCTGWKRFWN